MSFFMLLFLSYNFGMLKTPGGSNPHPKYCVPKKTAPKPLGNHVYIHGKILACARTSAKKNDT